MLHECFQRALGGRLGRQRRRTCLSWRTGRNSSRQGCGHDDAGTLSQDGEKLLHKKERASHVRCEEIVKVRNSVVFDARGLGDASIRDDNVEPVSNQVANLRRELKSRLRLGQTRTYSVGFASVVPDVLDEGICIVLGFSVMDKDASAGICQGDRSGATNSAGCAGNECSFVRKVSHVHILGGLFVS